MGTCGKFFLPLGESSEKVFVLRKVWQTWIIALPGHKDLSACTWDEHNGYLYFILARHHRNCRASRDGRGRHDRLFSWSYWKRFNVGSSVQMSLAAPVIIQHLSGCRYDLYKECEPWLWLPWWRKCIVQPTSILLRSNRTVSCSYPSRRQYRRTTVWSFFKYWHLWDHMEFPLRTWWTRSRRIGRCITTEPSHCSLTRAWTIIQVLWGC